MTSQIFIEADEISEFPLELSVIKTQLRIDHEEFDSLITEVHQRAAWAWAEGVTKRAIIARPHRLGLDDFPQTSSERLLLPLGKAQSIASIDYINGGVTTTLTGSSTSPEGTDYQEDLRGNSGAMLMPNVGASWPSVDDDVPVPIEITYTAGWNKDQIPADILAAIMWYIGEKLDVVGPGDITGHENAKDALLSSWRILRFD